MRDTFFKVANLYSLNKIIQLSVFSLYFWVVNYRLNLPGVTVFDLQKETKEASLIATSFTIYILVYIKIEGDIADYITPRKGPPVMSWTFSPSTWNLCI